MLLLDVPTILDWVNNCGVNFLSTVISGDILEVEVVAGNYNFSGEDLVVSMDPLGDNLFAGCEVWVEGSDVGGDVLVLDSGDPSETIWNGRTDTSTEFAA